MKRCFYSGKLVCAPQAPERAGSGGLQATAGGLAGLSARTWLGSLGNLAEMAPGETQQEGICTKLAGGAVLIAGRWLLEVKRLPLQGGKVSNQARQLFPLSSVTALLPVFSFFNAWSVGAEAGQAFTTKEASPAMGAAEGEGAGVRPRAGKGPCSVTGSDCSGCSLQLPGADKTRAGAVPGGWGGGC